MIKRIAVISGNCVRDTQIFSGNPAVFEHEDSSNCDEQFIDVGNPCHYIGIFEDTDEEKIRKKAAESNGVHPDSITLIEICNCIIETEKAHKQEQKHFVCMVCDNEEHSDGAIFCKICGNLIAAAAVYAAQCGFDKLKAHAGHHIEIALYGGKTKASVECVNCHEVLFCVDKPDDDMS